ncbi:MAG: hypothetical protein WBP92_14905 [Candidatus Acidiferrales bacterium]
MHGKNNDTTRPRWPMIVLKSHKGWTGPKVIDGLRIESTFRAHQVPLLVDPAHPDHVKQLKSWMKSYRPEELFDENGRLIPELAQLAPKGDRRMGVGHAATARWPYCSRVELCSKPDCIARRLMSNWAMTKKKSRKKFPRATLASITKEMAQPRFAESARKEEEANHHVAAHPKPLKRSGELL